MTERTLARIFMACYCCALIVLGVVTTPPSDPSVLVGDLPPMTVGYGEEGSSVSSPPLGAQ